jgi:hypothetical protein
MTVAAYDTARLHQSLSAQWGYTLEELNLSSGVPYFWDNRVGYVVSENSSSLMPMADIVNINYYKDLIRDRDTVYYRMQEYKVDILMTKDDTPYSLNIAFTLGCMFTNFFQSNPVDEDGYDMNNPLFVPGDVKCQNENGVYFLKKYGNIREGLTDAANFFNLIGRDVEDFTLLHKFHNFSLTAYRSYFSLCMLFLKGGEMYDRNYRVNRRGYRIPHRRYISRVKREGFWGNDISSRQRPAGRTWREDS